MIDLDTLPPEAAAEIRHLREQRDRLQQRCSDLVHAERAARGVLTLRWQRIGDHRLPVPARAHDGDAGLDLGVIVGDGYPRHPLPHDGRVGVSPDVPIVFATGWAVEIPAGWFGLLVVRSSIGKAGWDLESSGVIDAGYRGEILLPLIFRGDPLDPRRYVRHGDRMAQMLVLPAPKIDSVVVDALSPSARGAGSFGSTGAA